MNKGRPKKIIPKKMGRPKKVIPKKMGRPKIEIDWEHVIRLCNIQATEEEISDVIQHSANTLLRHCKKKYNITFGEFIKKHGSKGKCSLRRSQFKQAKKNPAMAIWLGKQWLGQKDKQEVEHSGEIKTFIDYVREINKE